MLGAFYFHDPRMDLVAAEHLATDGLDPEAATALAARPGWSTGHVALLERAIELYWDRYDELAENAAYLSPPRLRNLAVVREASSVRPYAQILNESTTTLHLEDLDPARSDPEYVAYLLAFAERSSETGEILRTAVHLAPWWFARDDEQCARFRDAARASRRPDADLYRAIADALPWLRTLGHRALRPRRSPGAHREIPGTGLLVPRRHEAAPDQLIAEIQRAATTSLRAFHDRHRGPAPGPLEDLHEWLASAAPRVLIVDEHQRVLWDPSRPEHTEALAARLQPIGRAVVEHLRGDLACIEDRTSAFLDVLREPAALAPPDPEIAQGGYTFLHRDRGIIAYNLDEPGIERLLGPGIPYARAMLGARTLHEWAHAAVDSGWVPRTVDTAGWQSLRGALADALESILSDLPPAVRKRVAPDLERLGHEGPASIALVDLFEHRLPDFQANILAARLQTEAEREAYVRQNIRPLRREYDAEAMLRMLVRYAYEFQYLRFSAIGDPRTYFFEMTWFDIDFLEPGILTEPQLTALLEAGAALCDAHSVDETQVRSP